MVRPFRFGLQLSRAAGATEWRRIARDAEALGYATLFVPDHFDDQFGPLVALTAAAEATTTLRVGALVLGNDYRHPVVLAKELATLDVLSGGRLEVGLGAGWMTSDYEAAGIVLDPPATRIARMAESLEVIKTLWSDEPVRFSGAHYRVTDLVGTPRPVQRPHPPIIVGGGGRRVLSLAGRSADIVGVNPSLAAGAIGPEVVATTTAEHYDERVAWVREAAGDRADELELQCLTFLVQVVDDREAAIARLAELFSSDPAVVAGSPVALVGTVEEIVATLEERRRRFGFSYVVVHEAEMEAFAPVVATLAGT
jgi:probable F420-dependent oxidoreductase